MVMIASDKVFFLSWALWRLLGIQALLMANAPCSVFDNHQNDFLVPTSTFPLFALIAGHEKCIKICTSWRQAKNGPLDARENVA